MSWIMDRIGDADMMREMDRKTIQDYGIPGIVLMENAGRQAFEFIMEEFDPGRAVVFAGRGNNGGDGFVIARHLANEGVEVEVILLARKEDVAGDAKTNLDALFKMGLPVLQILDVAALDDHRCDILHADLIVDAILGTGIKSDVHGVSTDAINFINGVVRDHPEIRVCSVDMPSGVNADNGQVMGQAVIADATATFGLLKVGQFCYPGAALIGSLAVVDIGIPRDLYQDVPYSMITPELASDLLPIRLEDFHKGQVGHGIVLAGAPGKTGAAVMAAQAALRAGAGLITLAGPSGVHPVFEAKTMEVMTEPLPETGDGTLGKPSLKRAFELMRGKTALAMGPGMGVNPEVGEFVKEIIKKCAVPMVIDADGLNAVAGDVTMLAEKAGPVVLTPHPGEMARLAGVDAGRVLADRLGTALNFAEAHKVIVVLKGAHTLVACPDGRAFFNNTGNPGMATGGTGDVLTGMILGLMCQGLAPEDAAVLGVYLHGSAGDLAAADLGLEAMLAGDVIERIPGAFAALRKLEED